MVAIGTVLLVVFVSLLITRVATVMLVATGLSREVARFQARSAFTGSGFTTSESERVVDHPVRRRVVMQLMLLGNAGIVAAASTLFLGFARGGHAISAIKLGELLVGLAVLIVISRSQRVDRAMTRVIRRGLARWTDIETRDYAELLELAGGYAVTELLVCEGDWLAGKTLADAALRAEGIAVLGLTRDGRYTGTPNGATRVQQDDTLLLYGRRDDLAALDCRDAGPDGDRDHALAVRRKNASVEE